MDVGAWQAAVHGVARSQTRLNNFTFTFPFMHWRGKWQPTPVFLPGESQERGSLVDCRLWGHTESDTTEATQQQQQQNMFYIIYYRIIQLYTMCVLYIEYIQLGPCFSYSFLDYKCSWTLVQNEASRLGHPRLIRKRSNQAGGTRGPGSSSVGAGPQAGGTHTPVLVHIPRMLSRQEVTAVSRLLFRIAQVKSPVSADTIQAKIQHYRRQIGNPKN